MVVARHLRTYQLRIRRPLHGRSQPACRRGIALPHRPALGILPLLLGRLEYRTRGLLEETLRQGLHILEDTRILWYAWKPEHYVILPLLPADADELWLAHPGRTAGDGTPNVRPLLHLADVGNHRERWRRYRLGILQQPPDGFVRLVSAHDKGHGGSRKRTLRTVWCRSTRKASDTKI